MGLLDGFRKFEIIVKLLLCCLLQNCNFRVLEDLQKPRKPKRNPHIRIALIAHIFFYYARGGQKRLHFLFDVNASYGVLYICTSVSLCHNVSDKSAETRMTTSKSSEALQYKSKKNIQTEGKKSVHWIRYRQLYIDPTG